MSEKTTQLSIIIRTVDQATAGLKKISAGIEHRVGKMTAPIHSLGESLGGLGHAAGFHHVGEAFKKVGEEAKEFGAHILEAGKILTEFSVLGVGIGLESIMKLVEGFTHLGHTAELVGLSADSLAGYRHAAEEAGVSVEEFDGALEKFNKNLGDMKAGGGKLKAFLASVSPALLRQVQAAKTNEEALALMAEAMKKVTDPTKRAALATAAFGKAGQPMINMLAEGSEALEEQRKEYGELAGSQEGAVAQSKGLHKAMLRIGAVMDGIKAAIVVGVGPALLGLAEQFKGFLVAHRAEIVAFIKDFGEKLPGRIQAVVGAFQTALGIITPVWNAIGGLKGAAIALAVVLGGKLIVAIAELTFALATNPFGLILVGIGLLVAAGIALVANWDYVKGFFVECWNVITDAFKAAWKVIEEIVGSIVDAVKTVTDAVGAIVDTFKVDDSKNIFAFGANGEPGEGFRNFFNQAPAQKTEAVIKVDFANAPKGTRVTAEPRGAAEIDLSVGYQLNPPGW